MASEPESPLAAGKVVALYGAAWQEPDEHARRELLDRCWAADGVYCDPTAVVRGREALVAHLGDFQERLPGHRLVLSSDVDEHHDWVRFGWQLLSPDGAVVIDGLDVGERDEDGRLRRIVGFFVPPAPA
jgi:hypothetical protein